LARALLRQPSLLLLDEATSALDTANEQRIHYALAHLHGELTIVMIAHRLSTVRMADHILVVEAGRVVETGTWDDLCARPDGHFRAMVQADRCQAPVPLQQESSGTVQDAPLLRDD